MSLLLKLVILFLLSKKIIHLRLKHFRDSSILQAFVNITKYIEMFLLKLCFIIKIAKLQSFINHYNTHNAIIAFFSSKESFNCSW